MLRFVETVGVKYTWYLVTGPELFVCHYVVLIVTQWQSSSVYGTDNNMDDSEVPDAVKQIGFVFICPWILNQYARQSWYLQLEVFVVNDTSIANNLYYKMHMFLGCNNCIFVLWFPLFR